MVHLRINERESNPNPHVNFITVLPVGEPALEEAARQLLRALAAQVKPIMKAHGFAVNSLEEYEYNKVFAGRNWNHGETIELVLRSSTGSLLSTPWLMSTLCHELAHIKHGNHGPAFQALWRQLQQEVRTLQSRGYYGDGYWSSGQRLVDSAIVAGQGIETGALPEYMCGGAHSRARPISRRPRKTKGTQSSRRRKTGARVSSSAFNSTGKFLNEDLEGQSKSHGIGFRKKAGSKRAREERALAAELRLEALRGEASSSKLTIPGVGDASEPEDEEQGSETDYDRRQTLMKVVEEKDLGALRATTFDPSQDFLLPSVGFSGQSGNACSVDDPQSSIATASTLGARNGATSGGFDRIRKPPSEDIPAQPRKKHKASQSKPAFGAQTPSIVTETTKAKREDPCQWDCLVCTLTNKPNHLACTVCGTPRGESKWAGETQEPALVVK